MLEASCLPSAGSLPTALITKMSEFSCRILQLLTEPSQEPHQSRTIFQE